MILSGQSIRKRGIFEPFNEKTIFKGMSYGLSAAGYDIRIAENLFIKPNSAILASSIEHFTMPNDLLGKVTDKSSWARKFLCVQNTTIEPGWCGYLTLELSNHSKNIISIKAGSPIAQIIFHILDEPTETPYNGKYQNQKQGPVKSIYELDEIK